MVASRCYIYPGVQIPPSIEKVVQIHDARTGRLLVCGVGK